MHYAKKGWEWLEGVEVGTRSISEKKGKINTMSSEGPSLLNERAWPFVVSHLQRAGHLTDHIRETEAVLRAVLDGISDPLLILSGDFSIKMLNQGAANYYGVHQPQAVIGKPCYQALRAEVRPCEDCPYPSVILNGRGGTFERKGLMAPEKFEQVTIRATEIGFLLLIRDITKAKFMKRQLIQSQRLASLGLLVSGVVHEIKNLNNCITFNIPLLREYLNEMIPIIDKYAESRQDLELFGMSYSEFREDIFRLLNNLKHASGRISETVSGLREFAGTSFKAKRRWIDLEQVIEKTVAICQCQIRKMVNSFQVDIAEDPIPILTDPEALEQILVNLLINAAQAAEKEDSWVRLTVKWGNGGSHHVIIEVSDNGCGIDEETRKKIFEPLFTTKTRGEGAGLGLSVSRSLIEEVGGCIEVESEPGLGSTFRVVLGNVKPITRPSNGSDLSART